MKKLHILLVLLLITATTFAQSTITITGSTINVNGTSYNVGSVYYIENYSNGTLQIKDRYSSTLILGYEKATNVINGTTSAAFTSQAASEAYLVAGGVGSSSSSSGGGSGAVSVTPNYLTYTDATVTLTGSTQQVSAAGNRGIFIQNLASTPLTINFGSGATSSSVTLIQYGTFNSYTTQSINVLGTASAAWVYKTY